MNLSVVMFKKRTKKSIWEFYLSKYTRKKERKRKKDQERCLKNATSHITNYNNYDQHIKRSVFNEPLDTSFAKYIFFYHLKKTIHS